MAGLMLYNDALLLVGGALTADPNCCCYYSPPPACPPCCIKIEWGVFNVGGDLTGSYVSGGYTIEVKIVMPTKDSRMVCHDQSITVEMEVVGTPDPGNNKAWARWGAVWTRTANSPPVSSGDGKVFARGLVEWGSIESRTYSVTLSMDKCFLDPSDMLAYIFIGMDTPSFSAEIEVSRCPTADYCCDDVIVCNDCCYQYASTETGWVRDGLDFCKVISNEAYTLILCAKTTTPGVVCAPDDSIELTVSVIPFRYDKDELVRLKIEWDGWKYFSHTPAIAAGGSVLDESPGHVDWGNLAAYEYFLKLDGGCDPCGGPNQNDAFGPITINFDAPLAALTLVEDITFTPCGSQVDCCPDPCDLVTGLFGTRVASSGTVIDPPADPEDESSECSVDAHWTVDGSPARWIPPPGVGVGCNTNWIGAHCSGENEPGGVDGFEAVFATSFEIAEGACLEGIVIKGRFSADNYIKAGLWLVNGVDQAHIEHGSYNSTLTLGCIVFEIDFSQGNWVIGTNTIAITVKNGNVSTGEYGGPFGILVELSCDFVVPGP